MNAELFHPSNDTFTALSSGANIPAWAAASALGDGDVLIAGGQGSPVVATAELFDPSTDAFTSLPASAPTELTTARSQAVAAPLPGGDVLFEGGLGSNGFDTDTAEMFVSAPKASVSGGSFGDQTVGDASSQQTLVVTNVGAQALRIASAQIGTSGDPGDFAITGDACGDRTLSFGQSCGITVQFTPSVAGARTATWRSSRTTRPRRRASR